nr:hypothetical protein BaRGS_015472 [Batillaria attramentaria]
MLEALDDDVKEMFHENLVVRAFVDIDVDMELRGFVFDGSLVALSQYHYLTYSPRLVEKQDELQARILSFYQNILKPKLQWNNFGKFERAFIIDFAVGSKDDKLWVTRIKPFMATVDAALFSWDRERHLLEGEEGFQFRINTRPKPGAKTMLPHSLKAILSV